MSDIDRRLLLVATSLVAALASGARGGPAAPPIPMPPAPELLSNVHPELRPSIEKLTALMQQSAKDADFAKRLIARAPRPLPDVPFEQRSIAGPPGAPDLIIYVINARRGGDRPAILHMHGGGYTAESARDSVLSMQKVAKALDCVVVTVDYRLAPSTTWRGSTEDNYVALKWLHANGLEIGADVSRIAVMGESAGGGHAALLAIRARDRGEVPLVLQCLTYPMLDDRTASSREVPPMIGRLTWTREENRNGWRAFLGQAPGGPDVPPAAVPTRTARLDGLAPAWIGVGAIDLFVDEDVDYARRLMASGVATELHVAPGAFHGFDIVPEMLGLHATISEQFQAAKLNALRRAFGLRAVV